MKFGLATHYMKKMHGFPVRSGSEYRECHWIRRNEALRKLLPVYYPYYQIIRHHELDAALVKSYATDFCGVKTLRDPGAASRSRQSWLA